MADLSSTRREFLKTTSAVAAGVAMGGVAGGAAVDPAKILNYNPKMGYRRLGKTGLMISEVSLGGHGGRSPEERAVVLDKAIELGMNYLDTNMADEVGLYGAAFTKTVKAKREKFQIGFGDWPVKITPEFENNLSVDLLLKEIDKRLKQYNTDMLDIWRPVGATWGPGQNNIATLYSLNKKALDLVVEAFEKAQKAGKVKFLGVSAHNPKVFRFVLENYPQFSVVIFPYLFLTKEFEGDSLLKLAKEKDVGIIGLKPFGAGTTFGVKPRQIAGKVDPRAHVLIKEMLQEPRISAVIPGVTMPEHLEENVKGSYERDKPKTAEDEKALRECRENFYAYLTPDYQWLRLWETV